MTGKQKVWPNNIDSSVFFYFCTGPINDFLSWTGWSPIAKVNRATKIHCKDSQHEGGGDSGGLINDDFVDGHGSLPIQIVFKTDQIFAEGFFHGLSCSHGLQLLVLLQPGL